MRRMMKLSVSVPSVGLRAAAPERSPEKARTVFQVDVLYNGRKHSLEKRYSEFSALHKKIKKRCQVPDFPPKHVPNWMTKVMEQRRQGLEAYLQGILLCNRKLPKELLDFLKLGHFQQDPKASNSELPADLSLQDASPGCLLFHRPVISFHNDPYIHPFSSTDPLPDVVLSGVLQGLYSPETLACLKSKLFVGPGQRPQRTLLPFDFASAPLLPA